MPNQSTSFRRLLKLTTALSMLALPAAAQTDSGAATGSAPPARVGEVAGITGSVSFNGAGSNGQWITATANYPVTTGDSLFTQAGAQAALAVDASRITLADNTELQITGLDSNTVAATESQGEIFLSVNYLQPGQSFVITTPRGTVTTSQNGNYDIAAGDQNNPTIVTVLAGAATVTNPGATLQVAANQAGVLSGTDQTSAQIGPAQHDSFINAMLAEIAPPPPSYAPPVVQQMTGVSQLANYGSWSQSQQYGAVWYPSVSSGWTPYREGHWAYVAPWGYTWVENEPWGFAPFHYGRWVDQDNRWGWAPAPAYSQGGYSQSYQPVYAPAVVSFFGAGLAAGITIGALNSGNVGWVPLGPNEAYYPNYPNYRPSQDYFRRINQVNVHNVTNINYTTVNNYNYGGLANRRAATFIPADAMSRGDMVSRFGRPATPQMLAAARPVGGFGGQGFHPNGQAGGAPGPQHNGPMALPPPNFQHRAAPAPQFSAFSQRRNLPPATISHQPAQPGPNGIGFAHPGGGAGGFGHPNGGQPPGPPNAAQHPEFATMPGFHAPPAPPGGPQNGQLHANQPVGAQGFHPNGQQHPAANTPPPNMQRNGPAAMPGYDAPPAPPGGQQGGQYHANQPLGALGLHPGEPHVVTPQGAPPQGQQFHPQAQNHQPQPQQLHPQQQPQPPAQQFHPQQQQHVQAPAQQFHPQQQQPRPPVQQFHPQAQPQPLAQQFHPQPQPQHIQAPVQQFHPQPQPQPQPQHIQAPAQPAQHPQQPHEQQHPGG